MKSKNEREKKKYCGELSTLMSSFCQQKIEIFMCNDISTIWYYNESSLQWFITIMSVRLSIYCSISHSNAIQLKICQYFLLLLLWCVDLVIVEMSCDSFEMKKKGWNLILHEKIIIKIFSREVVRKQTNWRSKLLPASNDDVRDSCGLSHGQNNINIFLVRVRNVKMGWKVNNARRWWRLRCCKRDKPNGMKVDVAIVAT